MKKILFILLSNCLMVFAYSQELISQVQKTVNFLYVANSNHLEPYGTGFIVSIPAKDPSFNFLYLVTAKHVLQTKDHKQLPRIYARLNTKDSSRMFKLDLVWSGSQKNVFVHSDQSVDLAVIPIIIPSDIEYLHIPIDIITKRSVFDSLQIHVGTEIFFSGLFTSYVGNSKLTPIFRFGKLCLIPTDRIKVDEEERDLLLIESASYGGNSGSPVFFNFVFKNQKRIRLAGVILGSFNQGQILGKQSDKDVIAWSSLGISAVTPAEFIWDILYSNELSKLREL